MKASQEVQKQVLNVLNEFNLAVRNRDLDATLRLFVPDPDIILIGSEAGEVANGREELKQFFRRIYDRTEAYSWVWDKVSVATENNIAWLFANCHVIEKVENKVRSSPYRITSVLQKIDDEWYLHMFHGSEPVK